MFGNDQADNLTLSQDAGFRGSLGARDPNPQFLIQSQILHKVSFVTPAAEAGRISLASLPFIK